MSRNTPWDRRHAAWQQLVRQRNKAVRLVEEMHLRIKRLYPLLQQLRGLWERHQAIAGQLKTARDRAAAPELAEEQRRILLVTRESRRTLSRRL